MKISKGMDRGMVQLGTRSSPFFRSYIKLVSKSMISSSGITFFPDTLQPP